MQESSLFTFDRGSHSFYGHANVTVVSGNPLFHGASLFPGASFDLFAPGYRLPLACETDSSFSLRIAPLSPDILAPDERRFYFPNAVPSGFNELLPGVFHSPIIRGATYPAPAQRYVDGALSKRSSRMFVIGDKSGGKSLFSRFAANRILNSRDSVAFLDLDPGQPELSLPGSLSLTLVREYLLNPPEHCTHLEQTRVFPGMVSIGESLECYYASVRFLLAQVPADTFLVVNSFGWVKDLGLTIHRELVALLECDTIFMLQKVEDPTPDVGQRVFRVEILPRAGSYTVTPRDHRELRIYSHFRRGLETICCQRPIAVPLGDVRLGVVGQEVEFSEVLRAICGSLVGLCWDEGEFPPGGRKVSVLRVVRPMRCVGFGIVRGIDKKKGILYVIVARPPEPFNTIVMGAVRVPGSVLCDTFRGQANYLGVGLLDRAGASTDPLVLKNPPSV
jgi:polynucleotide 5'-hydroxyl-kinase GRC3/NOL9